MSKKGAKGKGGKIKPQGAQNQKNAAAVPQFAPQAPSAVEEPQLPKFPAFDKIESAPTGPSELVEPITKLLGLPLRVTLSDGRFIIGDLSSLDNYRNLILTNTYQAHIETVQGCTSDSQLIFYLFLFFAPYMYYITI